MTMIDNKMITCAVCGTENGCSVILSSNALGFPDLDLRPAEMARSTIFAWVQRCIECGYCAWDIGTAPEQAKSIIKSAAYQAQLSNPDRPVLANSFLCQAMIDESAGDYASAAWALIHAAWICDDDNKSEQAKPYRIKSADLILSAWDSGQMLAESRKEDIAILIDVLRRAGKFSDAQKQLEKYRGEVKNKEFKAVLAFQESLIRDHDDKCHNMEEALYGKE